MPNPAKYRHFFYFNKILFLLKEQIKEAPLKRSIIEKCVVFKIHRSAFGLCAKFVGEKYASPANISANVRHLRIFCWNSDAKGHGRTELIVFSLGKLEDSKCEHGIHKKLRFLV